MKLLSRAVAFSLMVSVLLFSAPHGAVAKPRWLRGTESNQNQLLPPDVAFRVGARVEGGVFRVRWAIADGYYLYRQKMDVRAESPDLSVAGLVLPQGVLKNDQFLGTQQTYRQQVDGIVPYTRSDAGAHPLQIKVTYQGCADAGLCYLPITKVLFPTADITAAGSQGMRSWQGVAIGGGVLAFLLAGLILRKERRLSIPTA